MQTFTYLTIAAAALLQSAVAIPAITSIPTPTTKPAKTGCTHLTTVTTTHLPGFHCDIACRKPTRKCEPGEPPIVYSATTTTEPGCTVSVTLDRPACACPTCLA
ncbi:hypothetical protein F5Y06DRAFT_296873 [Hypoxylon sp. FL0890]|nr:hypothetical protein F5Y06DRAFT_296873 [Hypoxylon sp. FL0890]